MSAAVVRAGGSAPCQPRLDKDGWEVLFDGKDLNAWEIERHPGVWAINAQGELYPAKPGPSISTRNRYCDFVIELDYKLGGKAVLPEPGFLDPDTFVAGEGFINQRARGGQPATQWLPQVVPLGLAFIACVLLAEVCGKVIR